MFEQVVKNFEKVLDCRLRKLVNIIDGQFCFIPEQPCTDGIFVLMMLKEKLVRKKQQM